MEIGAAMKILVTGAGGYIGTSLVPMFLEAGHEVIGVDRYFFGEELLGTAVLGHPRFRSVHKDIRQLTKDDLAGVDAVIDLAGLSNDPACDLDPRLTEEVNQRGGLNVAACAKAAGVRRYVYSSSCSVYGQGETLTLTEESPLHPVSAYARAKIEVEKGLHELASDDFCVTLLRNATVYGYSGRMRFDLVINVMTLYAWRDRRIFVMGGGKQRRPLVHVKDVANAFQLVLDADPDSVRGETFNVGSNGQNFQVAQLANVVKGVLPSTELIEVPGDADPRSYDVCFDKISRVLGFEAKRTPVDGILEVKDALDRLVVDPSDLRTTTVKYYQYLLDAERTLRRVGIDGRIF
jgi:nucleoside-diphosphate-sugar epimerase